MRILKKSREQENQSLIVENGNHIGKPLVKVIKKKRKKTQITKIRNESGNTITMLTEIKRIMNNTLNSAIPTAYITCKI